MKKKKKKKKKHLFFLILKNCILYVFINPFATNFFEQHSTGIVHIVIFFVCFYSYEHYDNYNNCNYKKDKIYD